MLRNGMSPIQLSFIAGASPDVIAMCYAHLSNEDSYDAMIRALMPRPLRGEPDRPAPMTSSTARRPSWVSRGLPFSVSGLR